MIWDDNKYVGFDFEASGTLPEYALQPWRIPRGQMWATSMVAVWRDQGVRHVHGGLFPTKLDIEEFLVWARDEGRIIVGWNLLYDIGILIGYGLYKLAMENRYLDGMHVARHQFIEPEYEFKGHKKKSYSLKQFVAVHFPQFAGYQLDVDYHATDPAALQRLHDYNIQDVDFTLDITKELYTKLFKRQRTCVQIEAQCLPLVARANYNGMVVDVPAAHELAAAQQDIADKLLVQLAPHGVTEKIVRSPIQLSNLMYDQWKLPVLKINTSKLTGKETNSTDKEVLHELSFIDPRAKQLRAYREALGNKTKFADTPIESTHYNEDARTRPQAIVFGTYSGRMTYASKQGRNKDARQIGFALHQEKRDEEFRRIIVAPPGYKIVEFDAAGQEFRWMAIASKDATMLQLCLPGEDPHAFMGARIDASHWHYRDLVAAVEQGDKSAKGIRQLGKVANLSLQYRTSAMKLLSVARVQYNLNMLLPEARRVHTVYLNTYKGVPNYWATQIGETVVKGYVETFAGRRVYVQGDWAGSNGWSMASTAINYRIQGTGADQKYLALMMIKDYLSSIDAYFGWDLHDGIYLIVPDRHVEGALHYIKDELDNLPYASTWGFTPPIPLPWDAKVGQTWGDLKPYKFAA